MLKDQFTMSISFHIGFLCQINRTNDKNNNINNEWQTQSENVAVATKRQNFAGIIVLKLNIKV